jgi:hypothetical protein
MACLLLWTTHDLSRLPPGRQLPRQSSPNDAVLARDITCRITNRAEVTETAHLIPRSEERWFRENGMFQYTQPPKPGTDSLEGCTKCNSTEIRCSYTFRSKASSHRSEIIDFCRPYIGARLKLRITGPVPQCTSTTANRDF